MEREKLVDLVVGFTEAFNRDDLDGVMSFMAEDAIYDEFNGTINRGAAAIRAAFVPQFRGDYGKLRFNTEDLFVDATEGKALIRWLCTLETKRGPAASARAKPSPTRPSSSASRPRAGAPVSRPRSAPARRCSRAPACSTAGPPRRTRSPGTG